MLVLRGHKRFWLFDGNDLAGIHPRRMRHIRSPDPDQPKGAAEGIRNRQIGRTIGDNFSPVDPKQPDRARFPRSKYTRPFLCQVNAGDALYMPAFTWHSVENTGEPSEDLAENLLNVG